MKDNRIQIIGIGDNGDSSLTPEQLEAVLTCQVLVGGERHLDFFPDYRGERVLLKGGLTETAAKLEAYRQQGLSVVILASGDPLFFGIAGTLTGKLGVEKIHIQPHTSSLQLAAAKWGFSWQDAAIESIHGKPLRGLAQRIDGVSKVAVLTDDVNTPGVLARYLLEFGMTEYEAFVGEHLGGEKERCRSFSLEEMAEATFEPLNIVLLRRRKNADYVSRSGFGFEDEEFHQRKPEKGLITKKEIRVLSLSELRLRPDSVVWDIGAGSGSVAVECARLAKRGQVFALEKNEGDLVNMELNRIKFRADYTILHRKAPQGLEELPDPDAIFVGGSGGELQELIRICCSRLKPEGRFVLNAVTIETLSDSLRALGENGFEAKVTLLQVSRSKPILNLTRFEGLNPIYVITAERRKDNEADEAGEAAKSGRSSARTHEE